MQRPGSRALSSEGADHSLDSAAPAPPAPAPADREIRYEHSRNFAALLSQLNRSLLVSTYQAGKLAVVGASAGKLMLSFHNFERAMGIASFRDVLPAVHAGTWLRRAR